MSFYKKVKLMNKSEKRRLKFSLIPPLFFLMIMWVVKIIEYSFDYNWFVYGIYPLKFENLTGIIFSPFLHGDFDHLISNSVPFLFLGTSLFYFYREFAYKVFLLIYVLTGLWVWLAAREAYHIGASGMVYGLASFLFFSGLIHKNRALASLSLIIVFIYGSMIWGVLPIKEGMSWESHLFGAVTGLILTLAFARKQVFDETVEKEVIDELNEFSEKSVTHNDLADIHYFYKEEE